MCSFVGLLARVLVCWVSCVIVCAVVRLLVKYTIAFFLLGRLLRLYVIVISGLSVCLCVWLCACV